MRIDKKPPVDPVGIEPKTISTEDRFFSFIYVSSLIFFCFIYVSSLIFFFFIYVSSLMFFFFIYVSSLISFFFIYVSSLILFFFLIFYFFFFPSFAREKNKKEKT